MLFGGGLLDYVFFSSGEVKETIQGKNRAAEARYMSKTVEKRHKWRIRVFLSQHAFKK